MGWNSQGKLHKGGEFQLTFEDWWYLVENRDVSEE